MSAKEYLRQIKRDREYIRQLKARKRNLHLDCGDAIRGMDYSADKIQNTPKNTLEERGWELLERMKKIDETITSLSISIDKKLEEMHELKNDIFSQILFMHYSEYKCFEQIAIDLGYDYHYICQLHGEALKEFSNHFLAKTS